MNNPIPYNKLFATPDSLGALWANIERLSGSEKALAYNAAIQALNLAHKLVEEQNGTP